MVLEQEKPEVRSNLLQDVGPCFRDTVERLCRKIESSPREEHEPEDRPGTYLPEPAILEQGTLPVDWYFRAVERQDPEVQELLTQLQAWEERFGVTATSGWIIDTALRTLLANLVYPEQAREEGWYSYCSRWLAAKRPIEFESSWEPTIESEGAAKKRLRKELDDYLKRRFSEVDAELKKLGYERAPRRPQEEEKHLRWLVRFQILGQRYTAIARAEGFTDPNNAGRKRVENAVKRMASRLGLALHPGRRGRPPRSRKQPLPPEK